MFFRLFVISNVYGVNPNFKKTPLCRSKTLMQFVIADADAVKGSPAPVLTVTVVVSQAKFQNQNRSSSDRFFFYL
jgi:hypothetical protein